MSKAKIVIKLLEATVSPIDTSKIVRPLKSILLNWANSEIVRGRGETLVPTEGLIYSLNSEFKSGKYGIPITFSLSPNSDPVINKFSSIMIGAKFNPLQMIMIRFLRNYFPKLLHIRIDAEVTRIVSSIVHESIHAKQRMNTIKDMSNRNIKLPINTRISDRPTVRFKNRVDPVRSVYFSKPSETMAHAVQAAYLYLEGDVKSSRIIFDSIKNYTDEKTRNKALRHFITELSRRGVSQQDIHRIVNDVLRTGYSSYGTR